MCLPSRENKPKSGRKKSGSRIDILALFAVLLLISSCAGTPDPRVPGTAVAVWDFENLSMPGQGPMDLGELLTAKAAEAIQERGAYEVVERQRLEMVLKELNLGSSDLADEQARLNLGRLTGAKLMIFGAYQVISSHMRLDLRLVESETGRIVAVQQREVDAGNLRGWLDAAGAAALSLFEK